MNKDKKKYIKIIKNNKKRLKGKNLNIISLTKERVIQLKKPQKDLGFKNV